MWNIIVTEIMNIMCGMKLSTNLSMKVIHVNVRDMKSGTRPNLEGLFWLHRNISYMFITFQILSICAKLFGVRTKFMKLGFLQQGIIMVVQYNFELSAAF